MSGVSGVDRLQREVRWDTTEDTQAFGRALGALLRGGACVVSDTSSLASIASPSGGDCRGLTL